MDHQAAIEILQSADSFKLAETVEAAVNPTEIDQTYSQLALDLYWKSKNLRAVIAVMQMGIHYCLTRARDGATDEITRAALLDAAKKMAFNLASFCWSGWDEPGIIIRESELEVGADAARLNLRLAEELNRPARGKSLAHWMIGGYALAQKQFESAAKSFQKSIDLAREAKDDAQATQHQGFLTLARLGMKLPDANDEFAKAIQSLEAMNTDDAREYSRQLQLARKVFAV